MINKKKEDKILLMFIKKLHLFDFQLSLNIIILYKKIITYL